MSENTGVFFSVLAAVVFIALVIALTISAAVDGVNEKERLMNQCLKDHKEYECKALLSGCDESTTLLIILQ